MEISKQEFYHEKLQDENLEDHKLETTNCFIKKEYDTTMDRHAKKNRDNQAALLKEQGYNVQCSRTTNLRGRAVYQLWADKPTPEATA